MGTSHLKARPHLTVAPHSHSGDANTGCGPLRELPALSNLVPFSPRATWEAGQSLPVHSQGLHEFLKSPMLFFDFHAVKHAAQWPRVIKSRSSGLESKDLTVALRKTSALREPQFSHQTVGVRMLWRHKVQSRGSCCPSRLSCPCPLYHWASEESLDKATSGPSRPVFQPHHRHCPGSHGPASMDCRHLLPAAKDECG